MKHGLKLWLFAALFALTGCGIQEVPAQEEKEWEEQISSEQVSEEQASEAAKDQGQDMDTITDGHSAAETKEELNLYAQNLPVCDLSDLSLIYEKTTTEYYDYFYTQGLKGIPEKPAGCLCTSLWDFDLPDSSRNVRIPKRANGQSRRHCYLG